MVVWLSCSSKLIETVGRFMLLQRLVRRAELPRRRNRILHLGSNVLDVRNAVRAVVGRSPMPSPPASNKPKPLPLGSPWNTLNPSGRPT